MKQYLLPKVHAALSAIGVESPEQQNITFEQPRIESHGHLSTNAAMALAKVMRSNPRAVAEKIISALELEEKYVSKVEIAGPGFINFTFTDTFFQERFSEFVQIGSSIGKLSIHSGKTANVEYVSANPTGLLHVGHGRNGAIGDTVANILEWNGYKVIREYYFNNAGNQMNNLAKSTFARYRQALGEAEFPFPEDGYHGAYVQEIADSLVRNYADALKDETPENVAFCRKEAEKWCFSAIERTMKALGIQHEIYFNEDSLYTDGKVTQTVEALRNLGLVYEKDGATWFELTKLGQEQDKVIIKSSGEPTYRLPDIAYHVEKLQRNYDILVDVFGADHIATIPDVKAGVQALGYDTAKLKVLIHQFVTLMRDGEQVKMSKRTGNAYTLDDLIEELGADVVRFFFVMRGINTHLEFDLGLAEEQSEKNPVFYLQYAHARICSILRNTAEQGFEPNSGASLSKLTHPSEIALMKLLMRFPEIVQRAGDLLEPQVIAEYLREAAAGFHKFYQDCRILGQPEEILKARLVLAQMSKFVIGNGLAILGISRPEKM